MIQSLEISFDAFVSGGQPGSPVLDDVLQSLLGLTPKCNTHIITHNQASETSCFSLELILYIYSFRESKLNKFDSNLRDLY